MISAKVHWLTFTVFGLEPGSFRGFWENYLQSSLGELSLMRGGVRRGFQATYQALAGAKVYVEPLQVGEKGDYFSIELPGSACDCLTPEVFYNIAQFRLQSQGFGDCIVRASRIDLAVDGVDFTPYMVYEHYKAGMVRTWARRKTVSWEESPDETKEDGTRGTHTFYVGRGSSERMLRIYDKRGYTRCEIQLRDGWADVGFGLVCSLKYSGWLSCVTGLIDKYFSVASKWWNDFVAMKQEIDVVISSARVVTLNKMQKWLQTQVAPTIVILRYILGEREFNDLIRRGVTVDRLLKYESILQLGNEAA